MSSPLRIVLVGGGHAHLQVIKALNTRSLPSNYSVTLIDPSPTPSYSGMVPGCVSNLYTQDQTKVQLEPLARWAGVKYIKSSVVSISSDSNSFTLADSTICKFDVASLDIGSTTRGVKGATKIPGVAEFAIPTRPINELVSKIEAAETHMKTTNTFPENIVIVGAGPAGIELAFAMRARWSKAFPESPPFTVSLLDTGTSLLPNEAAPCQKVTNDALQAHSIDVIHCAKVTEITRTQVLLSDGTALPHSHVIWATGAASHPLAHELSQNGIETDDRGVNRNLQSITNPAVFAAGDCCAISDPEFDSPPKAGVYAVRSGPILVTNLVNYLKEAPLVPYIPQDDFLKLLMLGDGTAVGFRFGLGLRGKWVWKLKDHIDQMFMDLFKVESLNERTPPPPPSTTTPTCIQYDDNSETPTPTPTTPSAAARELLRTDNDVDFKTNWAIIQRMINPHPTPTTPSAAARELLRTDNDVDFKTNWAIIQRMMSDPEFKKEVLHQVHSKII
ncbi:hypothetical protein TL16_g03298 [Triparma laevis f. inornata]|uniref:FAD/NAD(P)-binding domain-containing protein n=1 Tax=Triparma laevis f. inornata TaxID=1714386 RepID=A0A9W7E451_9STRA|nr:hypothetical protein TL16_g03298 [Triparma laevis f. inornata]